ncbi:uncharacterized protein LOC126184053 [Schistocerca cancellata]|uniref:uncharacterized protein LOC126184053 n=1 Tax=Schistocerca cancellata TaxID=274614 RepID=UPI002118F945|nr:uncharacterized protein LOC126184053 [Schistocerca cancellata]
MAGNYYRLHSNDFGHARSPEHNKETEERTKNADNWSFSSVHYSYSLKNLKKADRHWLLNTESEHWKNVLEHLIAIIHFLGQHCLPLRGSTGTLFQPDNRNFLKLVELFGKFDTVMMEHLHRAKQGENKGHHYLGKETKNQIIHLIRSSITNNILLMMKSAKYYSIILDCTQDISKVDQMTVVVHFVQETRLDRVYDVRIWEHFLGFHPVPDSLHSTFMQVVLKFLEDKKILLCNMRGQGYANGANMKGKKFDLQKRISDMNKRSFYVPCKSLSLNPDDVLKKYLPNVLLKPLSDTRWESSINDLTPPRFKIGDIYDALVQISAKFNVSNTLQTTDINVSETVEMLEIRKHKMRPAEQKKSFKKPIHFIYEGRDETIDERTKRNKIEFYCYLLDIVITSLDGRFNQLKAHCDYFDFLYDIDELKNAPPDSLGTKFEYIICSQPLKNVYLL